MPEQEANLLHFAGVAVLAGTAPAFAHGALGCRGKGAPDEVDAVVVHGFPVVLVDAEVEALVASLGVDHDGAAVFAEVLDLQPELFAYARGYLADVDARADFEEPPREVPAEPGRACGQDDDYHASSA
jgi:hypothetical protein